MFRSSRYRAIRERLEGEQPPARVAATSYLLLGLIVGLIVGLIYAWLLDPRAFIQSTPARLDEQYREEYIFLVSQNYARTGDWGAAAQRLQALEDPELAEHVALLFEAYLRRGAPAGHVRNLARLTERVGGESPALALFAPTPHRPQVTATSTATPTPLPTATATRPPTNTPRPTTTATATPLPTATPRPVYRLLSQERLCSAAGPQPLIAVEVVDPSLEPLPGVEIIVTWQGGEDHFFTGFQPDEGVGYGDFTMAEGISYAVHVAEGSPVISGLRVEPCSLASGGHAGGWRLTFQKLALDRASQTPEGEEGG